MLAGSVEKAKLLELAIRFSAVGAHGLIGPQSVAAGSINFITFEMASGDDQLFYVKPALGHFHGPRCLSNACRVFLQCNIHVFKFVSSSISAVFARLS